MCMFCVRVCSFRLGHASTSPCPEHSTGMKRVWGFVQAGGGGAEIKQPIKVGELNDIFMVCSSQGLTAPPNYLSTVPTQLQIRAELCIHTKKWPTPARGGRLVDSWSVRECWGGGVEGRGSCVMFHSLITILLSLVLWCGRSHQQHKTTSNYLLHVNGQTRKNCTLLWNFSLQATRKNSRLVSPLLSEEPLLYSQTWLWPQLSSGPVSHRSFSYKQKHCCIIFMDTPTLRVASLVPQLNLETKTILSMRNTKHCEHHKKTLKELGLDRWPKWLKLRLNIT